MDLYQSFNDILEEFNINKTNFFVTTKKINHLEYEIADTNLLNIIAESNEDKKNFKFVIKIFKRLRPVNYIKENTTIIEDKKCIDYKTKREEPVECFYLRGITEYNMYITSLDIRKKWDYQYWKNHTSEYSTSQHRHKKINDDHRFYSTYIKPYFLKIKGSFPDYSKEYQNYHCHGELSYEVKFLNDLELIYSDTHFNGFPNIAESLNELLLYKELKENNKLNQYKPYNLIYDFYAKHDSSIFSDVITLRDLNGITHKIPLQNFKENFINFIKKKITNLNNSNINIYTIYPGKDNGFFHLKAYISYYINHNFIYPHILKIHSLDRIIDTLHSYPSYYQDMKFTYFLSENHPLFKLIGFNYERIPLRELKGGKSLKDLYLDLLNEKSSSDITYQIYREKRHNYYEYIIKALKDRESQYFKIVPSLFKEDLIYKGTKEEINYKITTYMFDKKFKIVLKNNKFTHYQGVKISNDLEKESTPYKVIKLKENEKKRVITKLFKKDKFFFNDSPSNYKKILEHSTNKDIFYKEEYFDYVNVCMGILFIDNRQVSKYNFHYTI